MACRSFLQQTGKLFIRWRDPGGIGRDHNDVMRIV
jgi:hypothetical protein